MNKAEEILKNYQSNLLSYVDKEGIHTIDIKKFIDMGPDNVFTKLNRTHDVLMRVANAAPDKLKWVNDYAMMKVIQTLYNINYDLTSDNIKKETEIERLQNEAVASRVAVETMNSVPIEDYEELKKRFEELENEKNNLERDAQSLLDNVNGLEADLQIRDNEVMQIDKELKDLQEKYNDLATENNIIVERHNNSIKDYEYRVDELNKEKNNCLNEINNLKNAIKDMTNAGDEANTKFNDLHSDYEKLNNSYLSLFNNITDLRNDYDMMNTSYTTALKDLETNKDNVNKMIDELRVKDDNYNKEHTKNIELNDLNNQLMSTIESQTNDINTIKYELEESTKQNAILQGKIKHTEDYKEKTERYDKAIKDFLNVIGLEVNTPEHTDQKETTKTQHRMGDNQIVDFNIGQ